MKYKKLLFIVSIFITGFFLTSWTQPKFDLKESIARGKEIYALQCISCHMEDGKGVEGAFPPLAGADFLKDTDRVIRVIKQGVRGSMKVNGVDYDGEMTGFELTDLELADVSNYIRNSWGNKGAVVKPEMIKPSLAKPLKGFTAY